MNILSSFTHPPAVPNLYTFPSHVEQKRRYFEEPNSCLSPLTSIVGERINWSQWGPSTVWLQHSSKYLIFCSTNCKERNSYRFVTRVSKWLKTIHFEVNYSFKTQNTVSSENYVKLKYTYTYTVWNSMFSSSLPSFSQNTRILVESVILTRIINGR